MNYYIFVCDRISMVFLLLFQLAFLSYRYPRRRTVLIALAVFLGTLPLEYWQAAAPEQSRIKLLITITETVIVQGTALLLSRYRDFRALFVGLSSAAYVLVGNMLATVVYTHTGRLLLSAGVQTAVHIAALAALFHFCREDFLAEVGRERHWGYFCLIPVLLYSIVYTLAVWPQSIYHNTDNALPILLVLLLMVVSYVLIFRFIGRMRRDEEDRHNAELLAASVEAMKRQIENDRQNQLQLSILKHDMRHDYRVLLGYLEAGQEEALRSRLTELSTQLDQIITAQYCENLAVNSVLQSSAALAARNGVEFRCQVQLDKELPWPELELAAVISNLTENAVQAAAGLPEGQPRYVRIKICPVKQQLLVSVANPYAGELRFSEETGLPISGRGAGHGYGMQSVRFFAERCHAVFDCAAEDGIFSVRLLIPMGKHV